ncbi:energy transducer TonB [candidate division CSSED10-310 bacterium]|uniref:Energy transducer TonB n=1 Tax=candidate division CSSED10-310 bacterium TaxID=2855610 RepID=A0ABV6YRY9_UNCC1
MAIILHVIILYCIFPEKKGKIFFTKDREYITLKSVDLIPAKRWKKKVEKKKKRSIIPIPDPSPELPELDTGFETFIEPEFVQPDYDTNFRAPVVPGLGPISVLKCDTPPRLLNDIKPEYTADSMIAGSEGKVVLELIISKEGKVIDLNLIKSSGRQDLDNSAVQAAKGALFSPALIKNQPVEVSMTLTIDFTLQ